MYIYIYISVLEAKVDQPSKARNDAGTWFDK